MYPNESIHTSVIEFGNVPVTIVATESLSGKIRRIEIEKDLYIYFTDLKAMESISLEFKRADEANEFHLLNSFFQPGFTQIISQGGRKEKQVCSSPSFSYIKHNTRAFYTCPQHGTVHCISIMFHQRWLFEQLRLVAGEDRQTFNNLKGLPINYFGSLSKMQASLSEKIFAAIAGNDSVLNIKADTYRLLALFTAANTAHLPEEKEKNMMYEVEEEILLCLKSTIPTIDVLAKKFHTSPSSLKRHFKETFGRSIYDYYLCEKMELAKKLITEQHLNVSQTASELGYESISHFSTLFTKHFGIAPGGLKRA